MLNSIIIRNGNNDASPSAGLWRPMDEKASEKMENIELNHIPNIFDIYSKKVSGSDSAPERLGKLNNVAFATPLRLG
ncbi:MAG: hypothetical protein R6U85_10340 [Salinivirgaceae bacterium]